MLIKSSKTCLFCRRVTLSECNDVVPQEGVGQGSGGQVPELLEDLFITVDLDYDMIQADS